MTTIPKVILRKIERMANTENAVVTSQWGGARGNEHEILNVYINNGVSLGAHIGQYIPRNGRAYAVITKSDGTHLIDIN